VINPRSRSHLRVFGMQLLNSVKYLGNENSKSLDKKTRSQVAGCTTYMRMRKGGLGFSTDIAKHLGVRCSVAQ